MAVLRTVSGPVAAWAPSPFRSYSSVTDVAVRPSSGSNTLSIMTDKEEVITILKATLLSCQGSISLRQCNRDYVEVQGEQIPFQKLGYRSLKEFFESIPGFRLTEGSDRELYVNVSASEASKNIVQLVARQKSTKKPSRFFPLTAPPPQQRRVKINTWKPNNAPTGLWKIANSPTKVSQDYYKKQSHFIVNKKNLKPSPPSKQVRFSPEGTGRVTITNNKIQKKVPPLNIDIAQKNNFKPEGPVRNSQDVKSPTSPVSPNSFKANLRSSAADRMNALQSKLSVERDSVPEISEETLKEEIMKLTIDTSFKENKSRLIELCKLMNLPEPVFKTCENKPNKGRFPSTYDCNVKVGTEYSFSTYPDSLNSKDLAIETAASKILEKLQTVALENKAMKPSTSPKVALDRIIKIVAEHPNGLWTNGFSDLYLEKFNEKLPDDWLNFVKVSPLIQTEEINGLTMLLPFDQKNILSSSSSTSSISNDESVLPPPLVYPEDSQWNVFIMSAYSTIEIWLRIIGEQYSDAFEELNYNMESYFMKNAHPSDNIVKGGWYAIKCEDGWLRARVLEIDYERGSALCFLVDTGDEESHPCYHLNDLPQQFLTIAPQAILCRLAGLEEYSCVERFGKFNLSDRLVGKGLIAEVLQIPDESNSDDPTITVILYDTSSDEDVNLNKDLLSQLMAEAKSPQLSHGVSEVYVTEVNHHGSVYAQIHNESWRLLQNMMQQVVSGPFPKEALQAPGTPFHPIPNKLYLAKSSSGEWRRAFLHGSLINSVEGDTFINVRYVDYGKLEKVPVTDLLLLERVSVALSKFPFQCLKLELHNVSHLNSENLKRLIELLRDGPVVCKQVLLGNNSVELFVRMQPHNILCSVNNAINMEIELAKKDAKYKAISNPATELSKKKERIFSNLQNNNNTVNKDVSVIEDVIPKFRIPRKGSQFNVFVSLAANPSNFTVQPLQDSEDLVNMMNDLQNSVKNLPLLSSTPTAGSAYAAFYEKDQSWYRVYVQGVVSQTMASIYFCDYGDLQMVEIKMLRELPPECKKLPAQALKAKLHGVSPINKDWSVEDCLRFQEMVVEKNFVSIIENVERDPLHPDESLLTLNLIDTSGDEDIYINKLLTREGRANLT